MSWAAFIAGLTFDQGVILICSVLSGWLITSKDPRTKRWGPVAGLTSQPFLIYATFVANQPGMFALSCYYLIVWMRGIVNDWHLDVRARAWLRTRFGVNL